MQTLEEKKKEFIEESATKLFMEKDITSVTMKDIAVSLGIGEATLYRYFGKKEQLIIECAILEWEKMKDKYFIYHKNYTSLDGYTKVMMFFTIFLNIYEENKTFFHFIHDLDSYLSINHFSSNSLIQYEQEMNHIKSVFDSFFYQGEQDGTIKPNINKDQYYFTSTHSLLSLCCKFADQALLPSDDSAVEQIKLLITMLGEYIKAK